MDKLFFLNKMMKFIRKKLNAFLILGSPLIVKAHNRLCSDVILCTYLKHIHKRQ